MRSRGFIFLILAPVVIYLATLLSIAAFVVHPPTLGWIGFGVASAIGLAIAGLAIVVFPRMRANADRVHPREDDRHRILVVADGHCTGKRLAEAVRAAMMGRPGEVLVVAPVLVSPLHFFNDDEERESEDARARLTEALQALSRLAIVARGTVGADDPLQAIGDAIAGFPADEILLAAPAERHRKWLEDGIERQVRDLYGVHVSSVVVESDVALPRH